MAHLTRGWRCSTRLPDTPERTQQELVLQTTLGPALMAAKGFAAPEVLQAYARAQELCQQVGETPQIFPVLFGLYYFHLMRAEYQTSAGTGGAAPPSGPTSARPKRLLLGPTVRWGHLSFLAS